MHTFGRLVQEIIISNNEPSKFQCASFTPLWNPHVVRRRVYISNALR